MKDTIDLLEIGVFFMLESRTHHFEYAQSGKEGRVPMDVATLRVLRWVCAVVCSESKDKVTYTLWFEYIGKVSAFHLKLFSQSKYCSACISITVGSFLWLTFAPFLQSSHDNILYHLERENLIIEGYKLIFWKKFRLLTLILSFLFFVLLLVAVLS